MSLRIAAFHRPSLLLLTIIASICCITGASQPVFGRRHLLQEESTTPTSATEEDIAALFDNWNNVLQTGTPEDVAALYDPEEGVLLPTVSNDIRADPAAITDYFVTFQAKQPSGRIVESYISINGPIAVHNGAYIFDLAADNVSVPARFTYVYRQNADGNWLILTHHSSAMPEEGYEAPADPAAGK
jgi:uncharacterized protein (TIGR02246 family)